MSEGLVARMAASESSMFKSSKFKESASAEHPFYLHILYDIRSYSDLGISANEPITEAMNRVYIIDFQVAHIIQNITHAGNG